MALQRKTARNIFIAGSFVCFAALAALTADFHKVVGERTHEAEAMTEAVVRGKDVWEKYNCINCHSRLGEGAYYAPDLTKAYPRMGETWMKHMLADPAVAYWGPEWNQKGRRKMPKLGLSEQEADDAVQFLKFLGQIDTNNWPPPESYVRGTYVEPGTPAWQGKEVFEQMQCGICHAMNGKFAGTPQGPDLTFVMSRLPEDWIRTEIENPAADYAKTVMPMFGPELLPPEKVDLLVEYFRYTNEKLGGAEIKGPVAQAAAGEGK